MHVERESYLTVAVIIIVVVGGVVVVCRGDQLVLWFVL